MRVKGLIERHAMSRNIGAILARGGLIGGNFTAKW